MTITSTIYDGLQTLGISDVGLAFVLGRLAGGESIEHVLCVWYGSVAA